MRTATLLAISSLIAGGLVMLQQFCFASLGLEIPYFNSLIFSGIKYAVVTPVVAIALNPLNRRLRNWRKRRGRDIEEEEKYETESGFISLTQKEK